MENYELYYEVKVNETTDKNGKKHNFYVIRKEIKKGTKFQTKFFGKHTDELPKDNKNKNNPIKKGDIVWLEKPENTKIKVIKILK
jgi:phage host-nuclease inhibitor protein Gam